MKIRVGIIFGGISVEHEVSIITAVQAMEHLDREKYEVVPIYITKSGVWYSSNMLQDMESFKNLDQIRTVATEVALVKRNDEFVLQKIGGFFTRRINTIDIAIPIVHGKGVEDGSLAGFLSTIGIPFAGPKVLGAALSQDKVVQKQLFVSAGINVPKYTFFYDYEFLRDEKEVIKKIEKLGYPVIVKPARLGSSIGIEVAENQTELISSIKDAITYDNKIVVEEIIPNLQEIDCAIVGNFENHEVAPLGEVLNDNKFFTFNDKYIGGGKKTPQKTGAKTDDNLVMRGFRIPAQLDKKIEEEIIETTKKAYKLFELSGVSRFDYLVNSKTKEVYLNEPNTIPGCLAFFFFKASGKSYTKLLDEMITVAIKEHKSELKRITNFDSNILSTYNGSKGTKGFKK